MPGLGARRTVIAALLRKSVLQALRTGELCPVGCRKGDDVLKAA
jgi:hypothetical protein